MTCQESIEAFLQQLGIEVEGREAEPTAVMLLQQDTDDLLVYNCSDEAEVEAGKAATRQLIYGPVMPDIAREVEQHLFDRGIRLKGNEPEKGELYWRFSFQPPDLFEPGFRQELAGVISHVAGKYNKPDVSDKH